MRDKTLQDLFIRICRDSAFSLDPITAAKLTASVAGQHPLVVWMAFPHYNDMERIATGEHAVLRR